MVFTLLGRQLTNSAKASFFFFLIWVTWQQGVHDFCFQITYKYGQMDSQQVDRFNLDIRCLNRGFSFKQVCPEILTCYHPHPSLASFNQEIHLRRAISFTPSARTGGGQADRPLWVLTPLYFLEVTGCLVEAHSTYVCPLLWFQGSWSITLLSFAGLRHLSFSLVLQHIAFQSQGRKPESGCLTTHRLGRSDSVCVCVCE